MKRAALLFCAGLLSLCVLCAAGTTDREASAAPPAEKVITNSIGMKLAFIPAGKFLMGSPADEAERDDNEMQHEVTISKPFYMGVYEVTQREFSGVAGAVKRPTIFNERRGGSPEHPRENILWNEAVNFCDLLSQKEEEKKAGRRYRLPTEAEWEYACRAGTTTPYHFGKSLSAKQANFNGDFPYGGAAKGPYLSKTEKVGSYPPNAWGLHDMHGNVAEWCADFYDKDYYSKSPKTDPRGPEKGVVPTDYNGFYRVIRGGCWLDEARGCRSAYRFRAMPHDPYRLIGFRVVCELEKKAPWPLAECPMSSRLSLTLLLSCSVFLLVNSGNKTGAGKRVETDDLKRVTLHVKDMAERLDLTWLAWPNKVQEALSGFPGVKSIDVDLKKDLLRIDYDSKKVTPQKILEVVGKQEYEGSKFEGTIISPDD